MQGPLVTNSMKGEMVSDGDTVMCVRSGEEGGNRHSLSGHCLLLGLPAASHD